MPGVVTQCPGGRWLIAGTGDVPSGVSRLAWPTAGHPGEGCNLIPVRGGVHRPLSGTNDCVPAGYTLCAEDPVVQIALKP